MLLFLASCRWWLHSTYQLRNLWPSCSSRYCYYYYHGIITTIINEKKYKTTSCCCAVLVLLTFFCLLVFVSSLSHTWLFVLKMHVRSFYYCFWSLNKERTKTYENCPEDHVNFVACQSRRTKLDSPITRLVKWVEYERYADVSHKADGLTTTCWHQTYLMRILA